MQTRAEVITALSQRAADLKASGIHSLYLFGSFARDQMGPHSDIDLLVRLAPDQVCLYGLVTLKQGLANALGRPVDITVLPLTNPFLRAELERDQIQVF